MSGEVVRRIVTKVTDEQLQKDLEKYRERAIELGVTDAKIITTDMILIDERVRAKCLYPKCALYGTNAQCPPYAIDLEQTRRIVSNFRYALFTRLQVPSEWLIGKEAIEKGFIKACHMKTYEVIAKIEAEAFYDGYHFALGFGCGPCKVLFCFSNECSALTPGQGCRHPLRARGTMEGVGMDVFTMAASVGWDVYPIGGSLSPQDVPFGATYGLLLVY